jgi:Tol biopolymer transport system component
MGYERWRTGVAPDFGNRSHSHLEPRYIFQYVIGRKLASYEVLEKLGEGGMGEVWRACDQRLNRMVAIKMLPPALAVDPGLRARFEQEARALGALNHPNIVTIYDVGQDEDGRAYMVSELVEGESLRAVLDRGPLAARKAVEFAGQIAEGMAAAHALGIIHRDLKPENVMVTKSGQVKLLDFGLAKQKPQAADDRTATLELSQPGTILGTAGYMSPEQVRAEPVDARSDIFSFGCVLYEMVAGRRAFRATSAIETMHAILSAEPLDFEGDAAKLPPALATIIRRCLEKRPEQRFQSAADLAFALKSISAIGGSAIETGTTLKMPVAPRAARKLNWRWLVGAGSALALLAAGYALSLLNSRPASPQYQRVTFRKGDVTGARFTPDGRNVVYAARWEGHANRVFLAVPGSPESRDLGLPDGSRILAVSSKDDLAFLSPNGALERMSLAGGQMRPLLDGVLDADWSPDGNSLAVLREVNGVSRIEYPLGTVMLDKIGSPLESIRVSPDGENIAFLSFIQGRRVALNVVNRAGKRSSLGPISAQTTSNEPSALAWSPNGEEIWVRSMDASDPQTIYAINLKGAKRTIANLPGRVRFFDLAKDGRILLSTGSMQFGILGAGPGDSSERDLSCLDQSVVMGISDDGSTILASILGDSAGPRGSIYIRKTDGSPAVRVGDGMAYRLSPDGRWVSSYMLEPDGSRTFGITPTGAGENAPLRIPGTEFSVVYGWFTEPQRYLVLGYLKGKRAQCFSWDAAKGDLKPICPEGTPDSFYIFLSPDKTRVVTPRKGGGWYAYSVSGGPAIEVHSIHDDEQPIGWRADSKSLFIRQKQTPNTTIPIWSVDILTGQRTLWKEIHSSRSIDSPGDLHLWITPDGQAYAYNYSIFLSDLYVGAGLR